MRKTKVLLVYPEAPETYWSMKHALPLIRKKALLPPLGLMTVASLLGEADFETRLIDMNVSRLRDCDIAAADLVMVSAMIVQKESFRRVVERCRRLGVPVAAGGPYPSSCRDQIEDVDFFILGEGEVTLPAFMADWKAGRPQAVYESRTKPELDSSPIPRFDLVDPAAYSSMAVQYSRGCPYDCEFCDIVKLFGRAPRTKSPGRFIAELEALLRTGARGRLFVVDDNFIGNKVKVKELLRELAPWQAEHGYPFQLSTEASIELARDDELLDLMVSANFRMVFIGLETPSAASLASTGKRQNLGVDAPEAVALIQSRGIDVTGGFIVGFDADPPDIFERQIGFIRKLSVPIAMVGILTALPGTRLHGRLLKEGRLVSDSSGDNTSRGSLNFVPKLPARSIVEGYYRVLEAVYRPRAYFERCLVQLRRLPPSRARLRPGERSAITPEGILCLIRSFIRQTFSPYGLEYLRYMAKAARMGLGLVGDFVGLAIQGRHFITITRRSVGAWRRSERAAARV